jgi:uncharacterized membrane protein
MTSSRNTTAPGRRLIALAAAFVLSLLAVIGARPAGAERPDARDHGRHTRPTSGDTCGNLLLRRGRFTPLSAPRGAASDPRATTYSDVNDRREIVGGYYEAGSRPDAQGFYPLDAHHAVLRDKQGRTTEIDVPGAQITLANALNDRAHVVGQYIDGGAEPNEEGILPAGTVHGFLWRRGRITTVDVPGAALTQPLGINDDGDIVGAYLEAGPNPDPYAYFADGRLRGFVLRDGRFTPVDFPGGQGTKVSGINDRGEMVGYYDTADARRGFFLRRGRFTKLDAPGATFTLPSNIDNRGRVVGAFADAAALNARGFVWEDGRYTTIAGPKGRTDTIALANNDRGDILVPSDGTYYRLPEIACGRPTIPSSGESATAPTGTAAPMAGPALGSDEMGPMDR